MNTTLKKLIGLPLAAGLMLVMASCGQASVGTVDQGQQPAQPPVAADHSHATPAPMGLAERVPANGPSLDDQRADCEGVGGRWDNSACLMPLGDGLVAQ